MSEPDTTGQGGRGRGWRLGIGAVVAVLIGIGIGAAVRSNTGSGSDGPSTSTPTASAGPVASSAPPAAVDQPLEVTAGAGGSRLAVDGTTPIGYRRDCAGAVSAATNYVAAAGRGAWVAKKGEQLLRQTTDADNQRIEFYRRGQRTAREAGITITSYPQWGGFSLISCDADTATVTVWPCEVQRREGAAQRSCVAVATVVAWVQGDWRLRAYEIPAAQAPRVEPDPAPGDDPLPAAERKAALRTAGPSWQEYKNAPA